MEDVRVPRYYEVKSDLSPEELSFVQHAIQMTPILAVIITNPADFPMAQSLGMDIVMVRPPAAQNLAHDLPQPTIVIRGNEIFNPIYEDVHEEAEKA